jgi:predicted DCC family thiol-disulfide oxidoreductase YuxK
MGGEGPVSPYLSTGILPKVPERALKRDGTFRWVLKRGSKDRFTSGMRLAMTVGSQTPVLIFDGLCGFCDGTVQLLLRVDGHNRLRFAPLQGEFAASVLAQQSGLQGIDSLILVEPGKHTRSYVKSEALLRIAWHLGGPWHLFRVFHVVPRPVRDWAYDTFARHRYRFFSRLRSCRIPDAEARSRFLD